MYATTNFKTKKALAEAVNSGARVGVFQPNDLMGRDFSNYTGKVTLEGPHYPEAHRWYANVDVKDGVIVRVA